MENLFKLNLQMFAANEAIPGADMASGKVPITGQDNSEISNRNVWLFLRRARYNEDSSEKQQDFLDFKMSPFYHMIKTNDNLQIDSEMRGMTRGNSSVAIAYDSTLEFTFRHHTLGKFAKEIMPIVENRWVNNKANVEAILVHDIKDKKWDDSADNGTGRFVGTGLRAIRYFGPLTFDNSHASGQDDKIVNIAAKVHTKTDPIAFNIIPGGSITQQMVDSWVEDFSLINHPMDVGDWTNNDK